MSGRNVHLLAELHSYRRMSMATQLWGTTAGGLVSRKPRLVTWSSDFDELVGVRIRLVRG
jgi:hypothetical protein